MPFLYRRMICRHAARFRWLHDLFEPMAVLSLAIAGGRVVFHDGENVGAAESSRLRVKGPVICFFGITV